MALADDVAAMCADAPGAVDVSWHGTTSRGPLVVAARDAAEQIGLRDTKTVRVLTIPAADLDGVAAGETVDVTDDAGATQTYRVRATPVNDAGTTKDLYLVL